MSNITNSQKEARLISMQTRFAETLTKHNDLSYSLFNTISKFSEYLPDSLNSLVGLSDMITDAVVVSGRSSASRSIFQLPVVSSSLLTDSGSGSVSLSYKIKKDYAINVKNSYLQSENNYSIFNSTKTSLSSFDALLKGTPIRVESADTFTKYTLALSLEGKVDVSAVELVLGSNTESYPLVSEIYYINSSNKKTYCSIANASDTKYDLDTDRQLSNRYVLYLDNVKTDKLYITLEDREKSVLAIDSLRVLQLEYNNEGEVIYGPLTSTDSILKAAIDVQGTISNTTFLISPDMTSWYELAAPSEISLSEGVNKTVSFNTVSANSIKSDKDFNEIYLKIIMKKSLVKEAEDEKQVFRKVLTNSSLDYLPTGAYNAVVNKKVEGVVYGSEQYSSGILSTHLITDSTSYVNVAGDYLVRGFGEGALTLSEGLSLPTASSSVRPLRVGSEVDSDVSVDAMSATIYGYNIISSDSKINTKIADNIVLKLKPTFSKDIYTLKQNNERLVVDFSSGFVSNALDLVFTVKEEGSVYLLDSTGKIVLQTEPEVFGEDFLITLEELFEIPSIEGLAYNKLYPLKLNADSDFSLLGGKIVCNTPILTIKQLSKLSTEKIDTNLTLSKENGFNLKVADDLLKSKYTEYSEEVVPAYSKTTVLKLKNKFIKEGSLVLTVVKDD